MDTISLSNTIAAFARLRAGNSLQNCVDQNAVKITIFVACFAYIDFDSAQATQTNAVSPPSLLQQWYNEKAPRFRGKSPCSADVPLSWLRRHFSIIDMPSISPSSSSDSESTASCDDDDEVILYPRQYLPEYEARRCGLGKQQRLLVVEKKMGGSLDLSHMCHSEGTATQASSETDSQTTHSPAVLAARIATAEQVGNVGQCPCRPPTFRPDSRDELHVSRRVFLPKPIARPQKSTSQQIKAPPFGNSPMLNRETVGSANEGGCFGTDNCNQWACTPLACPKPVNMVDMHDFSTLLSYGRMPDDIAWF